MNNKNKPNQSQFQTRPGTQFVCDLCTVCRRVPQRGADAGEEGRGAFCCVLEI
jgi:hypothetical protein